jgi:hypothetical protein
VGWMVPDSQSICIYSLLKALGLEPGGFALVLPDCSAKKGAGVLGMRLRCSITTRTLGAMAGFGGGAGKPTQPAKSRPTICPLGHGERRQLEAIQEGYKRL